MSHNAIKLLNIAYLLDKPSNGENMKHWTRYFVIKSLAAKLIGEDC